MLALFAVLFVCAALDIDNFVDKDVRIFFSNANHVFLGLDRDNSRLTARSKYYDLRGFSSVMRIVRDGSNYRMRAGRDPVCSTAEYISKCDRGSSWLIKERPLGYVLSDGSHCITLASRGAVKMLPCTDTDDQLFDFKLKSDDQDCMTGDAAGKKPEDRVIIINVGGDHAHEHADEAIAAGLVGEEGAPSGSVPAARRVSYVVHSSDTDHAGIDGIFADPGKSTGRFVQKSGTAGLVVPARHIVQISDEDGTGDKVLVENRMGHAAQSYAMHGRPVVVRRRRRLTASSSDESSQNDAFRRLAGIR